MGWFLPTIWRYRKPLFHVLAASLMVQLVTLATPLFFQVVVDKVLAHKGEATLVVLVAGMLVAGAFEAFLQYQRAYALAHTANRIDVELGQRLFRHLLRLPMSYFESRPAGQTVARVRELENVRSFLTGQALFSVLDLLFAFVFVGVLLAYSPKLTLVVAGTLPIYVAIAFGMRPFLQARVRERFTTGAASQQFLVEAVVGAQTIKAAAAEPMVRDEWEGRLAAYVKASFGATTLGALGQNGVTFVNRASTAILMLIGARAVMDGEMTIGALVAFNMIAGQVTAPVLRLSQLWQDFQQVQVSVERLGDVLGAQPEAMGGQGCPLPAPTGGISFRGVTFRYKPGSPDVLRGIDLEIRPGEVVGVVGASGSGKSTLTKLVQRLHVPQGGTVMVDGHDVSRVDPAWLRSNVGVVLQENLLFNRSIEENIAFAAPGIPASRVREVARLAGVDEFVSRLPEGYATIVEERGANLSGGQRQRIAIARALAVNPPILVFDEATSALDYESERAIARNMALISEGRTVIVVAHRLAAVRRCHRIVGMADGRIVEQGTHEELLAVEGGVYRRLHDVQNEGN